MQSDATVHRPKVRGPLGQKLVRVTVAVTLVGMLMLAVVVLWSWAETGTAMEFRIAAAADLRGPLPRIVEEFERTHPEARILVSYAASGTLASQIIAGAPFDVLLSAGPLEVDDLVRRQLADPDSRTVYAIGYLDLWLARPLPGECQGLGGNQGAVWTRCLGSRSIWPIAIGHPAHSPYGRAAEAFLGRLGLANTLTGHLVLGANAAQTAQFAVTGAVRSALVARATAVAQGLANYGQLTPLPPQLEEPLKQVAVAVRRSRAPALAREWLGFLAGKEAQALLAPWGFGPLPRGGL